MSTEKNEQFPSLEDQGENDASMVEDRLVYQIRLTADDTIVGTAATNTLSEGFIEVGEAVYNAAVEATMNGHGAWYRDGQVVPMPAPPPPPIVLSAEVLFFDRMTDDEYDALDASVRAGETARIYRGWAAATSFTEGSDMWTLLVKHLDLTVTAARRDELLARP